MWVFLLGSRKTEGREHPAAMQRGCATTANKDQHRSVQLLTMTMLLLVMLTLVWHRTDLGSTTVPSTAARPRAMDFQRPRSTCTMPGSARSSQVSHECKVITDHPAVGTLSSTPCHA
uniref:Uncharacterized protein n=1 Tax=Anopheles stephensi TaxID=30069 RepID=A0A182XZQ9_ANOST